MNWYIQRFGKSTLILMYIYLIGNLQYPDLALNRKSLEIVGDMVCLKMPYYLHTSAAQVFIYVMISGTGAHFSWFYYKLKKFNTCCKCWFFSQTYKKLYCIQTQKPSPS